MSNNFRTIINIPKSEWEITHADNLLLMGSCFSNNIGDKLIAHKFNSLVNPFGIVFNPASLVWQLQFLNSNIPLADNYIFEHNNLWHSWQHHSSFSNSTKAELLNKATTKTSEARSLIQKTDYLIITLGTAYAYKLISDNFYVSNCHQVPNKNFNKELIEAERITELLQAALLKIKENNKQLKVILTVSPVRHWKDGVVENQLSKANLIIAVQNLCSNLNWVKYFPSYELVMDDLRDYRFYKADMLHPNTQAVNYIWDKFKTAYFNINKDSIIERIEQLNRNKQHRSRFPESEQHLAFLAKLAAEEKLIDNEILQLKTPKLH